MSHFHKIPTLFKSSFLGPTFFPSNIPEIAAGYWWHAAKFSNINTTEFRIIEQNGKSSYDLVQTTITAQPTVLFENGMVQFRMRPSGDTNPSLIATSGAVTRGWTGATYIGIWIRNPNGVTGTITMFRHNANTAGNRGFQMFWLNSTPSIRVAQSSDGTAQIASSALAPTFTDSQWHWCEWVFDPTIVDTTKRSVFYIDLIQASPVLEPAQGNTLFDSTNSVISIANINGTISNINTTDWATCYYGNGIPDLENRKRLANYFNPTGILFI